jgi:nicotinic acid mononucleotide adenylyltransferase/nicotinamide mononucleotide (NMN) deamidase PncC
MGVSLHQHVEQIHKSRTRVVLAISGGGSRAIAELLEESGASETVLEAVVPYSEESLVRWLGGRPEGFCCSPTARAMAMTAFRRAWAYDEESSPAGVACTAALATDRPRRGPRRIHVAMQTASTTAAWSVQLRKDGRNRVEEEQLACRMVLNGVAEACGLPDRLELDLRGDEPVEALRSAAPKPWQDLLLGRLEMVAQGGEASKAIFSGAFNPLHIGHRRMIEIAGDVLDVPVSLEMSIFNVDKPPLDYYEIERRVGQFAAEQPLWLTRAATFEAKSRLFPGATFVVGADTLRRIAEPRYYADDPVACHAALERIADRGCRFLVFARDMGTGLVRLSDLELPDVLRRTCREVPATQFREDISSTQIRKSGKW